MRLSLHHKTIKIMLTTIENPVKKSPKKLTSQATKEFVSSRRRDKAKPNFSLLKAALVFIGLSLLIALSMSQGNLFLMELVVSSVVILILTAMKLLGLKET